LIITALVGMAVGSFVGVVADRVPVGRSVVSGRSRCGSCAQILCLRDLVPVFSWVVLRGRCRHCRTPIGPSAPAAECLGGACAVGVIERFGLSWEALAVSIVAAALIAQSVIDLRTHRLPREITYPALLAVVVVLGLAALDRSTVGRLVGAVVGAVIFTLSLGAIRVISRGGMGDGDVRLAPLLGIILGWWGYSLVPVAIVVASAAGAAVGSILIVTGRAGRHTAVPFGPFLAAGTLVVLWFAAAPT
jgi:leader peptidase (prepilin peptidase) / N-methyltransferase